MQVYSSKMLLGGNIRDHGYEDSFDLKLNDQRITFNQWYRV